MRTRLASMLLLLLALAASAGMTALGFWQWGRAASKAQSLQQQAQSAATPAVDWHSAQPPALGAQVRVSGHYAPTPGFWLDNQSLRHAPGAHAISLFVVDDGGALLVNRGWAALRNGQVAPWLAPPAGRITLSGTYAAAPAAGATVGMARGDLCQAPVALPAALTYPNPTELRCLFGAVAPGWLQRASPDEPGLIPEYPTAAQTLPPARHRAYALQWWAFAATLLVLSLWMFLRSPHDPRA